MPVFLLLCCLPGIGIVTVAQGLHHFIPEQPEVEL